MASVASFGTADRIVARTLFKVLRAGSGTRDRYSSTSFGASRLDEIAFFMRSLPDLRRPTSQPTTPDRRGRRSEYTHRCTPGIHMNAIILAASFEISRTVVSMCSAGILLFLV